MRVCLHVLMREDEDGVCLHMLMREDVIESLFPYADE